MCASPAQTQISHARSMPLNMLDASTSSLTGLVDYRLQKEYPGLKAALNYMQESDTVVVWRLGHIGHSLTDLVATINRLETLGFGFQSLQDSIDTTTSKGQFIYQIFAALGEFERNLIRERTRYGLAAARAMGRKGGRPKGLSKKAQHTAVTAERLYQEGNLTVKEICEYLSISRTTFYRYLRHREVAIGSSRKSHLTAQPGDK